MLDNSIFNDKFRIDSPTDLQQNTLRIELLSNSSTSLIETLSQAVYDYNRIDYADNLIEYLHSNEVASTDHATLQYYDIETKTIYADHIDRSRIYPCYDSDSVRTLKDRCIDLKLNDYYKYLDVYIKWDDRDYYIYWYAQIDGDSIYHTSKYGDKPPTTAMKLGAVISNQVNKFTYSDPNNNKMIIVNSNSCAVYSFILKITENNEVISTGYFEYFKDNYYQSPGTFANIVHEDDDYLFGLKFEGYDFNLNDDNDTNSTQQVKIFKQDKNDLTESTVFSDALDFDQFRNDEFVTDQIQGDVMPPAVLRDKVDVSGNSFNLIQYGYRQVDDDDNAYLKIYFKKFLINSTGDDFDSVEDITIDFGDYENNFDWHDRSNVNSADNILQIKYVNDSTYLVQFKNYQPTPNDSYYEVFFWKFIDSDNIKLIGFKKIEILNTSNYDTGYLLEALPVSVYYIFTKTQGVTRLVFDTTNDELRLSDVHFYHGDIDITRRLGPAIFQNRDRFYVYYDDKTNGYIPQDFKLDYLKTIEFEWAQDSYEKTETDDLIIPVTIHIRNVEDNSYEAGVVDLLLSPEGYFEDNNSREYVNLDVPDNGITLNVVVTQTGNLRIKGTVHE